MTHCQFYTLTAYCSYLTPKYVETVSARCDAEAVVLLLLFVEDSKLQTKMLTEELRQKLNKWNKMSHAKLQRQIFENIFIFEISSASARPQQVNLRVSCQVNQNHILFVVLWLVQKQWQYFNSQHPQSMTAQSYSNIDYERSQTILCKLHACCVCTSVAHYTSKIFYFSKQVN